MSFSISTYKIIKSLSPFTIVDIITDGLCNQEIEQIKKSLPNSSSLTSDHWKWRRETEFETTEMYISDSGFSLLTKKDRSKELELEFKKWNIFTEVWSVWYGGDYYKVGINYSYENFEKLYKKYKRNESIDMLLT